MSKDLLYSLNGNKRGQFRRWLDGFEGDPRIAWYPSSGEDFNDLLYLNPKFWKDRAPQSPPLPSVPDIFLHTDYFPFGRPQFLRKREIVFDGTTFDGSEKPTMRVKSVESLPRCDLTLDGDIVIAPDGGLATGQVVFLEIEIHSESIGEFTVRLVYVFAENAAFCAECVLPQRGQFSHVVHVRYGGGIGGGGYSTGIWLLNVLRQLHCEVFVTDSHYQRQTGDERIYELFPSLRGDDCDAESDSQSIARIESRDWSGHGDVLWKLLRVQCEG